METQELKISLFEEKWREAVVFKLAKEMLVNEHETSELYDPDSLSEIFSKVVDAKTGWVALRGDEVVGMLAALPSVMPLNRNITVLSEIVWYVIPSERVLKTASKLFDRFDSKAKEFDSSTFSLLPHSDVDPSYLERKGYEMKEFAFYRREKWPL